MFYRFYRWFRKVFLHLDDRSPLEISLANGLTVGRDFQMMEGCTLDPPHSFLITIGDRVTLAPRVHVIAHDASTKRELGYTRIAKVRIGSDVFIGAGSTILPGYVSETRLSSAPVPSWPVPSLTDVLLRAIHAAS